MISSFRNEGSHGLLGRCVGAGVEYLCRLKIVERKFIHERNSKTLTSHRPRLRKDNYLENADGGRGRGREGTEINKRILIKVQDVLAWSESAYINSDMWT